MQLWNNSSTQAITRKISPLIIFDQGKAPRLGSPIPLTIYHILLYSRLDGYQSDMITSNIESLYQCIHQLNITIESPHEIRGITPNTITILIILTTSYINRHHNTLKHTYSTLKFYLNQPSNNKFQTCTLTLRSSVQRKISRKSGALHHSFCKKLGSATPSHRLAS